MLLLLLLPLLLVVLFPIGIVQRMRHGTMRRQARGWLVALNLAGVTLSTAMLLAGALIASRWVPGALRYSAGGLAVGGALGLAGFALTRWERRGGILLYTPNRWLVLAITLVVATRIVYGFWRTWSAWHAGVDQLPAVAASGVAMSMAAGAVVLGYYLVYWIAVRVRLRSATTAVTRP